MNNRIQKIIITILCAFIFCIGFINKYSLKANNIVILDETNSANYPLAETITISTNGYYILEAWGLKVVVLI